MSLEEESLAWRRQVLEEATRLRSALKDAQKRRLAARQLTEESSDNRNSVHSETFTHDEMQRFEEAQARLKMNTSRLKELQKQVVGEDEYINAAERAQLAQLARLDMAQKEMERMEKRMEELAKEDEPQPGDNDIVDEPAPEVEKVDENTAPLESEPIRDEVVEEPVHDHRVKPLPIRDYNESSMQEAEDTWSRMAKEGLQTPKPSATLSMVSLAPSTPVPEETLTATTSTVSSTSELSPQLSPASEPLTPASETSTEASAPVPVPGLSLPPVAPPPRVQFEPTAPAPVVVEKKADFIKPKKKEEATFDLIRKEMHLTSSPLVFFNLACFQGTGEAELDVMHPICGYAVAGRLLAVMGPPGTDTSTLRVALSDFPREASSGPQRDVLVADFTVKDLIDVSDHLLRPDDLAPSESLINFLGLEAVGEVLIGTCIQRGAGDPRSTLGTPRGSRNPDIPTPRNPTTPRFRGSQAAVQKSVLLMEDLTCVLDPESIFRVLRILHRIAIAKRASVIVTLNKPFERRGLFNLFDDLLFFTEEGVSYFGPARRFKDYQSLIGSPCPSHSHPTDHILNIQNAAAKYDESPIKKAVDAVILEYTGTREVPDQTPRTAAKPQKSSKPLLPIFRRKKKAAQKDSPPPAPIDEGPAMSNRARRLADKLALERRMLAQQQKAEEKLADWIKLSELDMHIARGQAGGADKEEVKNFEHMLTDLQKDAKRQRPSCFMNLACFMNVENPPDKMMASVIQPTCAFANEGCVMGVIGPTGSDASNLLASLRFGSENTTTVTDMTVRDTLKLSEFLKNREKTEFSSELDSNVDILVGKMMLKSCAGEAIGTLIQRGNDKAAASTQIEIGDKILSTAVRSILLLDRIHALDAQSLFVVLKLLKRIAVPARLAIIFMMNTREEGIGLFNLMDNVLIFSEEGVGYFGPAKHLVPYCALVGFPCPEGVHVTEHFKDIMMRYAPSRYEISEHNTETPFTVRYQYSALAKYNQGIITLSTKPQSEGGNLSSRTFIPKSFRKKTTRQDQDEATIEKAELARQHEYIRQSLQLEKTRKQHEQDAAYEAVWKKLAETDIKSHKGVPLTAGLDSIVSEMNTGQQRPSLFFNLACFLPNITTDRIDMMQPICGYALIGRVVAIMGPPETDLSAFLTALSGGEPASSRNSIEGSMGPPAPPSTPRMEVLHRVLTVLELLKIAESTRPDRGSQPLLESANGLLVNLGLEEFSDVKIGTFIQRGLSTADVGLAQNSGRVVQVPSILMLDRISEGLDPQASFVVLKLVKRIAAQAQMAIIVHLPKAAERRGLFSLLDDLLLFDQTGVSYFGPANRLRDYLLLVGMVAPEGVHETDHLFERLRQHEYGNLNMNYTNTSPPVRYKYSPLAKYVQSVVERYTKPAPNDYDLQTNRSNAEKLSKRGSTFIPKGTQNTFKRRISRAKGEEKRRLEEEEAALHREMLAEAEAEAERQRVAEAEAESVWASMLKQSEGGGGDAE